MNRLGKFACTVTGIASGAALIFFAPGDASAATQEYTVQNGSSWTVQYEARTYLNGTQQSSTEFTLDAGKSMTWLKTKDIGYIDDYEVSWTFASPQPCPLASQQPGQQCSITSLLAESAPCGTTTFTNHDEMGSTIRTPDDTDFKLLCNVS